MQPRITAAVGIAVVSAVIAAPAFARSALTQQVNVTFTDHGCRLQVNSVSHRNTTIVFHLINDSSGPAGIVISSTTSKLTGSQVGAYLTITFQRPGRYPYRCTRGSETTARGVFTIRKN